MGATEQLARFVASLRYEDIPAEAVDAAKAAITDGVSVMVAGSRQPLSDIVSGYVRQLGGAPHCTVAGRRFKTNAPSAAFANGVFGHCLDFEIQGDPPTHGTSSCLPAALALGEQNGVDGKTIITSYVLGWEVQGRIRAASAAASNPAYHPPGLVGPLGGAAAAAKTLGLDAHQTHMALGIAASRTGGLTANTGTMVKSTHPGNAARMGVESALLAQAGFESTEHILEETNGYADALFGGRVDWGALTSGLGETFRLTDPGYDIKRFPAQVHMQRPIEAVLGLRREYGLNADMVRTLTLAVRDRGHSASVPRSGLDGKFSVEYCAAVALVDGKVGIDTFTDERRFRPDIDTTLGKVRVVPSSEPQVATATAVLHDGSEVSYTCDHFRGAMANPMSVEERLAKARTCVRTIHGPAETGRLIVLLERLDEQDDLSELMRLVGGP